MKFVEDRLILISRLPKNSDEVLDLVRDRGIVDRKEVSETLGISPSAALYRLKRLLREGFICSFTMPQKIGAPGRPKTYYTIVGGSL